MPRTDGDATRAVDEQAARANPAVHVAAAARTNADQDPPPLARRASLRRRQDRSMIPGNADDEEDDSRADASGEIRLPATLEATGPAPARAEVAIVGGGVMGLAIAYYLARRGLHDV